MLRKLVLYLIKPSKYDDEGYVIRHWVGVVPSNTLATLRALTEDVRRRRGALGAVEIEIHQLDETVQRIPVAGIWPLSVPSPHPPRQPQPILARRASAGEKSIFARNASSNRDRLLPPRLRVGLV